MTHLNTFCRLTGLILFVAIFSGSSSSLQAQDSTDSVPQVRQPIGIINLASIDRSLNDLGRMFELTGRSDVLEVLLNLIVDKAGDLKGIDRKRPVGYMVFLSSSLPPTPIVVFYLPVENEDELIATLKNSGEGFVLTKTGESTYEVGSASSTTRVPARMQDGYLLVSATDDEPFLETVRIPNPLELTKSLTTRYDFAATLNLRGVPPLMKGVFASFFTQQSAAQMQQRDHESDASYQARRAGGLSSLQLVEQLIRDGEEVTIGIDSTEDGRRAVLELNVQATPDSEFAKCMTSISGAPSIFTPLHGEKHPLQLTCSWNMDKREKTAVKTYVEALRLQLRSMMPEADAASIDGLAQTLQSTVSAGHIDGILQFVPYRDQQFVLLAGVKVVGGNKLAADLRDVSARLSAASERIDIDIDMHQFEDATFSRLKGINAGPGLSRIYGGPPDLYYGVGGNVLWLGFGGSGTLPMLERSITAMSSPVATNLQSTAAPFQAIFRAVPWLQQDPGPTGARSAARRELMESAMKPEDDAVRVEIRPTDNGSRVTIRFDEGFVRLLGMFIAQEYDKTQL